MIHKKDAIKDLFRRRTRAYDRHTKKILEAMSPITDIIRDVVFDDTPLKDHLKWTTIVYDKPTDVILLIGEAAFPIGFELEADDGKIVKVDKRLQDHLTRVIQVGLPCNLVEEGDEKNVKQFLTENTLVNETPNDPSSVMVEAFDQGFEDDGLTEAQKQQILYFEEVHKGKIN